jgi:phosphate/phosphite/phosphonate ABC transporter binding protein
MRTYRFRSILLTACALCAVLTAAVPAGASLSNVRIGVLAHRGHDEAMRMWSATADYLNTAVPGRAFTIIPLDFNAIGPAVQYGNVEFVIANSTIYVEMEALYGTTRIATMKNRKPGGAATVFGGVIFCRADRSDINQLKDLKGKTFMAADATSFGGYRMAWRELLRNGIDPKRHFKKLDFANTHDGVVIAVRDGAVDAGTVRTDTLERMAEKGVVTLSDFRVINERHTPDFPYLHSTVLYPEWPFAKVKHTPDDLAQRIVVALLQMPAQSDAATAAKIAGWTVPLDYGPVHELMKELRIGPYEKYGAMTIREIAYKHRYWIVAALGMLLLLIVVTLYVLSINRQLRSSSQLLKKEIDERNRRELEFRLATTASTRDLEAANEAIRLTNAAIETEREALSEALEKISYYIQQVSLGQDTSIRYANPKLRACWGVMNCTDEACECYKGEPQRCWQITGSYSGNPSRCAFSRDFPDCMDCPVFKFATEDRVRLIGEHFNNMMHLLDVKSKELQSAYAELKATQSRILQQEKMASIGQLAAGVAHEINNPMGFVISNLGTLRKYSDKLSAFLDIQSHALDTVAVLETPELVEAAAKRKELKIDYVLADLGNLIRESLEGAERVKKIVQDLRNFSRIDEAEVVSADINAGIESTLNILWNELKYKAAVAREYGAIPKTKCNIRQMNQVFMNLLANAGQAIKDKGTITIRTAERNGCIEIAISDTGSGISQDKIGRIFEPFFTTKEVGKGTGLGLSIAYDIVKKHNGTIAVESEPGKGTTFTVVIPVVSETVQEPVAASASL